MKVKVTGKGYSLTEVPAEQLQVVMDVLDRVSDTCFKEDDDKDLVDGKVPSGDGFVMVLSRRELVNFYGFKTAFSKEIVKLLTN